MNNELRWTWWVGFADAVEDDGEYNLDECRTRDEAISSGMSQTEPGDAFYIVEATILPRDDDEDEDALMRFGQTRNRERIVHRKEPTHVDQ